MKNKKWMAVLMLSALLVTGQSMIFAQSVLTPETKGETAVEDTALPGAILPEKETALTEKPVITLTNPKEVYGLKEEVAVQITASEGYLIYYTLDGSSPLEAGILYTEELKLSAPETGSEILLQAIAVQAEEPKAEEPKAEEPKAEEAKAGEPKAEEAKAEKPKAEEPKAEEPKAEEPKAEEALAEAPASEAPAETQDVTAEAQSSGDDTSSDASETAGETAEGGNET